MSAYEKSDYREDLPADLRRLIDHTERGVERLYKATQPLKSGARPRTLRQQQHQEYTTSNTETSASSAEFTAHGVKYKRRTHSRNAAAQYQQSNTERSIGGGARGDTTAVGGAGASKGDVNLVESRRLRRQQQQQQQRKQQSRGLPNATLNSYSSGGSGALHRSVGEGEDGSMILTDFGQRWDGAYRRMLAAASSTGNGPTTMLSTNTTGNTTSTTTVTDIDETPRTRSQVTQRSAQPTHASSISTVAPPAAVAAVASPADYLLSQVQTPAVFASTAVSTALAPSVPIPVTYSNPLLEGRVEELLEALRQRDDTLLNLKVEHAKECVALREAAATARSEAARDTAEHLAATYAVKHSLTQSALDAERVRSAELLERAERVEARANKETERYTQERQTQQISEAARVKTLEKQVTSLEGTVAGLERQLLAAQSEGRGAVAMEREAAAAREEALKRDLKEARRQRQQQEEDARSTLRQLEEEFAATSGSYQELLAGATQKLAHLEKVQRRYRALKESQAAIEQERERAQALAESLRTQREAETAQLRSECAILRERLSKESTTGKEASEALEGRVSELETEVARVTAEAATQRAEAQRRQETVEHTVRLLRSQLDTAQAELREEQEHVQSLGMETAQRELQLSQELLEQRKAAAAFKTRSEDALAALKRQLKEKDASLKALAAGTEAPLQRLRAQLEDERTRRARLEDQFATYKRKAKEAEEAALREMRREQLRGSGGLMDHYATRYSPSALTHIRSGGGAGSSGNTPSRISAVVSPSSGVRSGPHGTSGGGIISRVSSASPASPTAAATTATGNENRSPPQVQTTSIGEMTPTRQRIAPMSVPLPPPPHLSGRTPQRERDGQRRAAGGATARGSTDHNTTDMIESISGISCTSPCESTSRIDEGTVVLPQKGGPDISGSANGFNGRDLDQQQYARERTRSPRRSGHLISPPRGADGDTQSREHFEYPEYAAHEQRMNDFHSSAAEVFRKITGSREQFLAQCAAIIRRSSEYEPGDAERDVAEE